MLRSARARRTAAVLPLLLAVPSVHASTSAWHGPSGGPTPQSNNSSPALLLGGAGSRLWTYGSGGEGWVASVVALGNAGTEVLSQFGPFTDYLRMVSSYAADPATPSWEHQEPLATMRHRVDSAETTDVHVSICDRAIPGNPMARQVVLRKHQPSVANGTWEYLWPVLTNGTTSLFVRTSKNGQTIAAVVHNVNTGQQDVAIFGPSSNVPLRTFSIGLNGPARACELSADGRVLALPSSLKLSLIDTITGGTLWSTLPFAPTYQSHGLSGDGSVYAYGGDGWVKIVRRNAATGQYALAYTHTIAGACYCDRLDVSQDGSTLACGFNFTDNWNKVVLQALDLGTFATTMSDTVIGSGIYQNACSSIRTSADGSRFAVGMWGDQNGLAPEVRVYRRDLDVPLWTYDLPGSVNAIDLSADGKRVAVASKATHANVVAGGGRIDLFRVADEDLSLLGVPRAGHTVEVTLRGQPGTPAILLTAPTLAAQPTTFPNIGTLYLSRTAITPVATGTFDAQGEARLPLALPATVGTSLWLQGFSSNPRRLGGTCLKVTTLP